MSDNTWLSDYLFGEGTDAERAEAERRLAADPALRAQAEQLGDVTDRLRALPGLAWEGLDASPEPERSPGGFETSGHSRRSRPTTVGPPLGACPPACCGSESVAATTSPPIAVAARG